VKVKRHLYQYTPAELREFRANVKTLRDQGLIPGKVNLTRANPRSVKGGKFLYEYINKYDDVISGKQTAVPLAKLENKANQRKLYETVKTGGIEPHVLVPHIKEEKVSVVGGVIKISHPKGIERLEIPIKYTNLNQYLKDLKAAEKAGILPELKGSHYYAFNMNGGQSHAIFRNIDELVKYLHEPKYKNIRRALRTKDPTEQLDTFRTLEIVKTTSPVWWNTKQKRDAAREERKRLARNKRRREARAAKRKKS